MSQDQAPYWKDILSAAVMTGGKMIPGVSRVVEVIETVENRREATFRHGQTLASISRVEKSITETIERELKSVLEKLHTPNLTHRELEEEVANLHAMRGYGREPFLSQGLVANSHWYEQLRSKPNLYGRVLQDSDKPSTEYFYMFIDADKTRLLEVSPFALQKLLESQPRGAPAAKLIGQTDIFAQRVPAFSGGPAIEPVHGAKTLRAAVAFPAPRPAEPATAITNSLRMKFALIKPGTFTMGSPADEKDRSDNETQHQVTLTRPFYMGVHHVTRGQFAAFVNQSGYKTDAEKEGWAYGWTGSKWDKVQGAWWRKPTYFEQTDTHPVVTVSWNDAMAFVNWLNGVEAEKKLGRRYRLPTEAQWEYACRAGTKTAYNSGNDEAALAEAGWYTKNSGNSTHPIGEKKPNSWGLYDMHGNAWQWCQDIFAAYPSGSVTDPAGPKQEKDTASRVLRGGSWNYNPQYCRAACRYWFTPDYRFIFIGFRICLDF